MLLVKFFFKFRERKMTIDLDSWELGYADGQRGRPYNVRQISTAFHIPAAIAMAAHILLARTRINVSTDLRGASTARQFRKPRLRASFM